MKGFAFNTEVLKSKKIEEKKLKELSQHKQKKSKGKTNYEDLLKKKFIKDL